MIKKYALLLLTFAFIISGTAYATISPVTSPVTSPASSAAGYPSTAFSPLDVTGLTAWYDASDASTITESGGAVSQWDDKSANGYDATQGTGSKQPTTGSTCGTKNCFDYDGVNDHLLLPSGIYGISTGANTVFVVYKSEASGGDSTRRFVGGGVGTNNRWGVLQTDTTIEVVNRTSSASTSQSHTKDTSLHIAGMRRSGTSITPFHDGVEGTAGSNAENVTLTKASIGAIDDGTQLRYHGQIAEILVYNSSLSDADVNTIGNYLADKWGGTWADI